MPARKYPKYLTCEYCGKEFFVRKASYSGNGVVTRRFCSLVCKLKGYIKPELVCLNCGEVFEARASDRSDTGRQKFCSTDCRWQYERNKRPQFICERCGKTFSRPPSSLKHGNPRFCSQSCAGNMKTSKNERFRRLKTTDWVAIRKSVIKRDGGKCRRCGTKEVLTVHHVIKWAISKDDSPSNLITLCRSCHYSIEWNGVECPTP